VEINSDFSVRAVAHGARLGWVPSPMAGVDRRMLDRIGGEVARATSIVRYAPGSVFSPHTHEGGEEFLVLEGVFQDETGDFPAGSYVRNPPTSSHRPRSEPGCTILVKLWQFDQEDRTSIRARFDGPLTEVQDRPGVDHALLFDDGREQVRVERWGPGSRVSLSREGGVEVFVLGGSFRQGSEGFSTHSWLRMPGGGPIDLQVSHEGCQVWVKEGRVDGARERFERMYQDLKGQSPQ
jgi:hypothetical protein